MKGAVPPPPVGAAVGRVRRRLPGLTAQVLLGAALGALAGFLAPAAAPALRLLSDIFLRLVKSMVAPLVFTTIVVGILAGRDLKSVGRMGLGAIIYFEIISTVALAFSLIAANLLDVGGGLALHPQPAGGGHSSATAPPPAAADAVLNLFPNSLVGAFGGGEVIPIIVLALLIGIALLRLDQARRAQVEEGLATVSATLFEVVSLLMRLAPLATFGALAFAVGTTGPRVLLSLLYLILCYYAVTIAFMGIVFAVVAAWLKVSLLRLVLYLREELAIVFGTASSEPALPRLLVKLQDLGCSTQSVGLVLPAGYAFNLDGTAIYMAMGVTFIAHAYQIHLDIAQQLALFAVMMVTSKGVATVSGASFVVLAATITSTGLLPIEGLPVLFSANRLMGMITAVCNTLGNCLATIVVAKLSGQFDQERATFILRKAVAGRDG